MTNVADAVAAEALGIDAIGLIFAAGSKRRVDVQQAHQISLALGPTVARVGVFVNTPVDEVLRIAQQARLTALQLHGRESEQQLASLAQFYPIIRALRVSDIGALVFSQPSPYTLLLDGVQPGSGHALNWQYLAAHLATQQIQQPWWLAGGVSPENVHQALQLFTPLGLLGVDAVSSLEASPGLKNLDKMRTFVHQTVIHSLDSACG